MKRSLTIAMAAAALLAASAAAWADTYYTLSSPRIIQVTRAMPDDVDDVDPAPAPPAQRARPRAVTPKPVQAAPQKEPRRKPFGVALPEPPPPPPEPEPAGPKRALLSAPPPPPVSSIHDGPTPLRPTPRFGQPRPEQPAPLTTFTPPAAPKPVASAMPAPEPVTPSPASLADDNDDHLPPPGDPRLAPPEPAQ